MKIVNYRMTQMAFYKIERKNETIFVINGMAIDDKLICQILSNIKKNKKIGLDLKNVKNINSPLFIENLLLNKFRLFNLRSEILAYLAIVLKDGFLKSHMSYEDFKEKKRELIRRKLYVA